jgi:iron complex transport system substrate-binding protein
MAEQWSRRGFLRAAAAAGLLAAAPPVACSSPKPPPDSAGGGQVKIAHVFGETTISAPPRRVVSAGYTGQDDLLAVNVAPVAVTEWFGDQPFAVWPWARPKLGDAKPVVLSLDDGIPVGRIANLSPDLIVATNAGVDQVTYQKLSAIAPTIPQADGDAFFEPWKVQATAIGRAVFQAEQMKSLIDGVDQKFTTVGEQNPQFKDRSVLLLQGTFDRDNVVAAMPGWRTEFLTQMGLVIADSAAPFAIDQQRALIPRDKIRSVLDAVELLIWTTESEDDQLALLANADVAALRSRSLFTTLDQAGAIAFASPLSYALVADQFPPLIAKIVG